MFVFKRGLLKNIKMFLVSCDDMFQTGLSWVERKSQERTNPSTGVDEQHTLII